MELGQQIETSVGDQPTRKPVPKRAETRNATRLKEIERLTQLTEVLELMGGDTQG